MNLPPAVAKIIFEDIEKGVPVLCYHLEGTQTNKTTKDSSGKTGTSGKEKGTADAPNSNISMEGPGVAVPVPAPGTGQEGYGLYFLGKEDEK